jgi:Protein of unknown function (DUF2934)
VPKKSKDVQTESANGAHSRVKKVTRTKPAAKPPRARKEGTAKPAIRTKPSHPTDEQIRLRAYFIAEQRARFSLKGDHNSDWVEAKRQLLEEAGVPAAN